MSHVCLVLVLVSRCGLLRYVVFYVSGHACLTHMRATSVTSAVVSVFFSADLGIYDLTGDTLFRKLGDNQSREQRYSSVTSDSKRTTYIEKENQHVK